MAGTKSGALRAKETNMARDPDFYKKMGAKGGSSPKTRPSGFATMDKERLLEISAKGGTNGKRGKWTKKDYQNRVKQYAQKHNQEIA